MLQDGFTRTLLRPDKSPASSQNADCGSRSPGWQSANAGGIPAVLTLLEHIIGDDH